MPRCHCSSCLSEAGGDDVKGMTPRTRPCASCPYRRDVPSGIWETEEYEKLPCFDGTTMDQVTAGAFNVFACHTQPEHLCAGWVGCHDMNENLAIRRTRRDLDLDAILAYQSPIPLFASGAEAAAHGKRDIPNPSRAAERKIGQLLRRRELNR